MKIPTTTCPAVKGLQYWNSSLSSASQASPKDNNILWKSFHFSNFKTTQLAVKFQDSFIVWSHFTKSPTGAWRGKTDKTVRENYCKKHRHQILLELPPSLTFKLNKNHWSISVCSTVPPKRPDLWQRSWHSPPPKGLCSADILLVWTNHLPLNIFYFM